MKRVLCVVAALTLLACGERKQEPKAEDTGKKVPVDKEVKGEKKKKSITDKKEINGTPKDKPAVKKTAPVKNGKSAEDDK